jgi:hypothetical protein
MKRLIGSAATKEQLLKVIGQIYCSNVSLVEAIDGSFDVHTSKGKIVGVVVKNYKGRWRFESIE